MSAHRTAYPGGYLLLLALTGASLGIATVEGWKAVSLAATADWWGHALVAVLLAFTAAYLYVLAKGKLADAVAADLPEPVDPNARDSRAYSR